MIGQILDTPVDIERTITIDAAGWVLIELCSKDDLDTLEDTCPQCPRAKYEAS